MGTPFWKSFHECAPCPNRKHRLGSHPKCCDDCPYPVWVCGKALDCGERCFMPLDHDEPCLCIGDVDGEPGSCPA